MPIIRFWKWIWLILNRVMRRIYVFSAQMLILVLVINRRIIVLVIMVIINIPSCIERFFSVFNCGCLISDNISADFALTRGCTVSLSTLQTFEEIFRNLISDFVQMDTLGCFIIPLSTQAISWHCTIPG